MASHHGFATPGRPVLIEGATVIDGLGGVFPGTNVLIDTSGRISSLGDDKVSGGEVDRIDLGGHWIVPGLVNAHDHLSMKDVLTTEEHRKAYYEIYRQSPIRQVLRGARGALSSLASGVTTVRDAGSIDQVVLELRDAVNAGNLVGPRIATCGSPISPPLEGQGVQTAGMTVDAATPEDMRTTVERLASQGVDYIKVKGHRRDFASDRTEIFSDDHLKAAVEASHAAGLRVTFHAWHPEVVEAAVRYGADAVEHGNTLVEGDRLAERMAQAGVGYVPNIVNWVPDPALHEPWMNAKAAIAKEKVWLSVAEAIAAGVAIGVGTDLHTPAMSHEMKALLALGMSPVDVIAAATRVGAEILGWQEDIGTVEPGKFADLVVLDSDPLVDVTAFDTPSSVFLGGVRYRPDRLVEAIGPQPFSQE